MITRDQLKIATAYNSKRRETLYDELSLPWPWWDALPDAFVWMTALFQLENALMVDGKLGPVTLRVIRRVHDDKTVRMPVQEINDSAQSNAIIVDGQRVMLPDYLLSRGMTATNYLEDGERRFVYRERKGGLKHFVLHETCGNTANGCKNTLVRKGYGVQLILSPSGHLSCHGDLVRDRMVHANHLNGTSFGIEIVNPYNPIYVVDKSVWANTISRKWWTWVPAVKTRKGINEKVVAILKRKGLSEVPKRYVTPTQAQMNAIHWIASWLCALTAVPYEFPTKDLNRRNRKMHCPGPGIVAHSDFASHSDGRYILESLIDTIPV